MASQPVPLPGMIQSYNQQLGLSQNNYQNVLNSFGAGQSNLSSALPGIAGQYSGLNQQVQSQLGLTGGGWGIAAPAAAAIGNTYAAGLGSVSQQMANAGLGNSTVMANLKNQQSYQASQAYGQLGAQLAQTGAGYTAQLGQAGLAAQMQGLGLQTNLYGQQGSTLAGYHYPNIPSLYGEASTGGGGGGGGGIGGSGGMPPMNDGFAGPGASSLGGPNNSTQYLAGSGAVPGQQFIGGQWVQGGPEDYSNQMTTLANLGFSPDTFGGDYGGGGDF